MAVKGQQSMYKSTAATVSNKSFIMENFTQASVGIDVQISGFATSYSYYVGEDGLTQSVETANNTANDWMGEGSASYTITRTGIPAALLTFESFKLTVDGKEYPGDEATKLVSVEGENGHTTWGQKDIVATVVYKDLDGNTYTGTKTITRHITGLPYRTEKEANPSSWTFSRNDKKSGYLVLKEGTAYALTAKYHIPSQVNIKTTLEAYAYAGSVAAGIRSSYEPTVTICASETAAESSNKHKLKGVITYPEQSSFSSLSDDLVFTSTISKICIYTKGDKVWSSVGDAIGVVCKSLTIEYR